MARRVQSRQRRCAMHTCTASGRMMIAVQIRMKKRAPMRGRARVLERLPVTSSPATLPWFSAVPIAARRRRIRRATTMPLCCFGVIVVVHRGRWRFRPRTLPRAVEMSRRCVAYVRTQQHAARAPAADEPTMKLRVREEPGRSLPHRDLMISLSPPRYLVGIRANGTVPGVDNLLVIILSPSAPPQTLCARYVVGYSWSVVRNGKRTRLVGSASCLILRRSIVGSSTNYGTRRLRLCLSDATHAGACYLDSLRRSSFSHGGACRPR